MDGKPTEKPKKRPPSVIAITKRVAKAIARLGFDVFVQKSRHSKSHYLSVSGLQCGCLKVRISDHSFPVPGRYDFDVYTASPRKGARDYTHFLAEFRRLYAKGG
jgi:hypothetical protein